MKRARATAFAPRTRTSLRGFVASVVVLALLAVMAALLLSLSRTVAALDRELRLIEQRQQARYPATPDAPRHRLAPSSQLQVPAPGTSGAPAAGR